MTAAELIKILKTAPPDSPIHIWTGWGDQFQNFTNIRVGVTHGHTGKTVLIETLEYQ